MTEDSKENHGGSNRVAFQQTQMGIEGLDEVLLGGVRKSNVVLVEGGPGAGKTTLGLEFIYRGASMYQEPGLVVTFELGPEKLLRDAHGFGWNFTDLENRGLVKLVYTSPLVILEELQSPEGVLYEQLRSLGAKRVLIDGLSPLKTWSDAAAGRPFRDSLHMLVEGLQRFGATAMLTSEKHVDSDTDASNHHERFVCDTIFSLTTESKRRGLQRFLEVTKSRGQDFISGRHTMRIRPHKGIEIFRRTQSRPKEYLDQPTSTQRSSIGNEGLDHMLGGGLYEGSVTLLVGISGTGKTVIGTRFLAQGAEDAKKGLLITLDEHPRQLLRNAESLGIHLAPLATSHNLFIHYDSPLEVELDVHFDAIVKLVEKHAVRRVVIDSLAAYGTASPGECGDFIYALATFFKNRLVTALFNHESPELLGISQISEELKASHLVDNIILLNYVEVANKLRRAITVPKARGSRVTQRTQEFTITSGGLRIFDDAASVGASDDVVPQLPFSSYYGLLSRSPPRKSPLLEIGAQTVPTTGRPAK